MARSREAGRVRARTDGGILRDVQRRGGRRFLVIPLSPCITRKAEMPEVPCLNVEDKLLLKLGVEGIMKRPGPLHIQPQRHLTAGVGYPGDAGSAFRI